MNKVILIGRITKDPELRKTPTDVSVVQFTLAVNRNYQNQNGETQADFINCVAWRNQADNLARFIRKGSLLAVEGSIQTRQYDDQNGVRRYVTEVICGNVTFLESKKRNENEFGNMSQLPEEPVNYQSQRQNNNFNNSYNNYNNNNNNYNNNNYQNNPQNQQASNKNPFDFENEYDISDDELPF